MSIKALNWAWDVPGLKPGPRVVLLKLADHANRHHQCWPSVPFLADKACLTERQVERILKDFERAGIVEREPWEGSKGTKVRRKDESTYLYTLAVRESMQECLAVEAGDPDTMSPRKNVVGDNGGTPTPTSAHADPDIQSTPTPTSATTHIKEEPTTEPTTEPKAESAPAEPGPAADPAGRAANVRSRPDVPIDWNQVAVGWNEAALASGLATIERVQDGWKRMFRTRLKEPGFDWPRILERVRTARGLRKSWADFEFFIKNDKGYAKLLSGKYDEPWEGGGAARPAAPPWACTRCEEGHSYRTAEEREQEEHSGICTRCHWRTPDGQQQAAGAGA